MRRFSAIAWFRIITVILMVLGLCNIYSATFYMNIENGVSPYYHAGKQMISIAVGLCAWAVVEYTGVERIRKARHILVAGVVFLLILVIAAGPVINGSQRWFTAMGMSVQPSEFAKLAAVIWAAAELDILVRREESVCIWGRFFSFFPYLLNRKKGHSLGEIFQYFKPLWVPFLLAVFVMEQPDMGTAVLIMAFPVALYYLCGLPWKEVGWTFAAGGALVAFMAIVEPYRRDRLISLWDPFSHANDLGYQTVQSLIAVGSGGFLGQGVGMGLSKYLYLPEQHTDFAFAVFSQEWGFLASALAVIGYLAILLIGFHLAAEIPRIYPSLLVYGLSMMISVQGLLNIAMVIGCFPVTGVPLPFISYGGTSIIMNLISVGLIGSAVRYGGKMREKDERQRRIEDMSGPHPVSLDALSNSRFPLGH